MKVLFDTNVIIDVLAHRYPFYNDSRKAFEAALSQHVTGIVGAGSITDVYYIIKKNYAGSQQAQQSIADLVEILLPVDTKAEDIQTAIKLAFSDFEDAVICATAIREKANYILTRNIEDFANSPVNAVAPADFLKLPKIIEAIGSHLPST
jgi:predicted nucleic acid-binding protein